MRIRIHQRLFLTLLATSALSVICMFFIMQWSLGRGFLQYINTVEQQRFEWLSSALVQAYGEKGDWHFLKDDPENWLANLLKTLPPDAIDPEIQRQLERRLARRAEWRHRHPPPPPDRPELPDHPYHPGPPGPERGFEGRIFLLDEAHQPVFGPPYKEGRLTPLLHEGKTIGYLGTLPHRQLSDTIQLRFVEQQRTAMAMVGGVVLLLSIVISLPVAKRFLRPIHALAEGTHRLAGGDYAIRVPILSSDELGQLARDFNALALALATTEETRRQWVADISHELRTPLAILRGEIEALQDGIRPTTETALHSLHGEVMHLGRLVDDLYQLSLSDVGGLTYRKETVAALLLLEEVLGSYRSEFDHKGIELTVAIANEGRVTIFADRERLHQLFSNLLDNSLRYTDENGKLAVSADSGEGQLRLHFKDSGPGVPAADLPRLFDRLYRVESSRNRNLGGAGLGLAICKNIVTAHEGTIIAQPSPLGGLWVTVTLPLSGEAG